MSLKRKLRIWVPLLLIVVTVVFYPDFPDGSSNY